MSALLKSALSVDDLKTPGGGAAVGGAAGAATGLLVSLFRENPSLKQALKDSLIGGAVGAAGGGIGGAVAQESERNAPITPDEVIPTPRDVKSVLAEASGDRGVHAGLAGLSGYIPVAGPAIYGGLSQGPEEAARLGVGSAVGTAAGGLLAGLLLRGKGGPMGLGLGGVAGSMLGSGAAAATDIGKSASAQDIGKQIDSGISSLGKTTVSPFANTGGAAIGGLGGAALGGTAGLLQAAFDGEDDGILSTLRKALMGGAVGGLGGAALGATGSHIARNRVLDKAQAGGKLGPEGKGRGLADQALRRYVVPVKPALDRALGGDEAAFNKEVGAANSREAFLHTLAALLAPRKTTHFLDGSATPS